MRSFRMNPRLRRSGRQKLRCSPIRSKKGACGFRTDCEFLRQRFVLLESVSDEDRFFLFLRRLISLIFKTDSPQIPQYSMFSTLAFTSHTDALQLEKYNSLYVHSCKFVSTKENSLHPHHHSNNKEPTINPQKEPFTLLRPLKINVDISTRLSGS